MMSFLHLPTFDSPTMVVVNLVCVFILALILIRAFLRSKKGGVKNARANNGVRNNNADNTRDNNTGDNAPGDNTTNS